MAAALHCQRLRALHTLLTGKRCILDGVRNSSRIAVYLEVNGDYLNINTQLQKSAGGKSHYTPEFKEEALAGWRQSGGIGASLLPKPERLSEMQSEIERLRAKNAALLDQREVLKNRWASCRGEAAGGLCSLRRIAHRACEPDVEREAPTIPIRAGEFRLSGVECSGIGKNCPGWVLLKEWIDNVLFK